ncbi:MAG: YihY/virulence factor BrkB family protein [Thermomicrobiales bacterium]
MLKLNSASTGRFASKSRVQNTAGETWRARPTDDWFAKTSWWRSALSLPRWMYRGYNETSAGDLAAAVAYHALVALVPMFLLLVTIAGLFLQSDEVLLQATETIDTVFPSGGVAADAFRDALAARNNSGLFGLFSFLGFAWAGTGFVSSLARSMNRIYGVRNSGYVNEKQRGFIIILIFAVFFLISAATSIVTTLFVGQDAPEVFQHWGLVTGQSQFFGYLVAFGSAVALFLVIYRIVPNAGQHVIDVWPGALVAALLFSVTTQAFPIYIRLLGGANRYGVTLGLVSLIVAATYILAHIILFGAFINATYLRSRRQKRRARTIRRQAQQLSRRG